MRDRHFRLFSHVYRRMISALMRKKWVDSSWENKKMGEQENDINRINKK